MRSKMFIAVIAPPWLPVPPPAYGGTESVIDHLARGYAAAGHRVLLCTTGDSTTPVPRHALLAEAQPEAIGKLLPELRHVLDAYEAAADADIVHDHTLLGPLVAREASMPIVSTAHGPLDGELQAVFAAASRRATVVAISRSQAGAALPGTVSRVIHHGLDTAAIPVGEGGGGYLAFLGRCTPSKGITQAIEIARTAGVPLRIAAKCREPEEHEYYEQCVRPLLGGEIEYLGELGTQEKYALLGGALALLNPIQWEEPFGLVMAESLATGTPILALPRGSAPEIVDDGVTGFVGRDESHLVRLVPRVATLDRRACRAAAVLRFSAERMVVDYLELFRGLLGGSAGSVAEPAGMTSVTA